MASAAVNFYRIGRPGVAWDAVEKAAWAADVGIAKRSYADEVLAKLEPLRKKFEVQQYGALTIDPGRYPLMAIKSPDFGRASAKPKVLVTGGVHGYETSGVQGALLFASTKMEAYSDRFDICVLPCVSPWGYECIQRWSPNAVDPNRSFYATPAECPCEEGASVVKLVAELGMGSGTASGWAMHVDLHETTNSDVTEFRPAKAARDGEKTHVDTKGVPDGFYLVADSKAFDPTWAGKIIESVRQVTHIAPPDGKSAAGGEGKSGVLLGEPIAQDGVICIPMGEVHVCGSVTGAPRSATTEVYPDSPSVTVEACDRAQVASIVGALDALVAELSPSV